VNQGGSKIKTGWNKKVDSNLNTECPIAASDFKIFQKMVFFLITIQTQYV
jgi:hypothetical protein